MVPVVDQEDVYAWRVHRHRKEVWIAGSGSDNDDSNEDQG